MYPALIGKKVGMTQMFAENGAVCGVTVVRAGPCVHACSLNLMLILVMASSRDNITFTECWQVCRHILQ